MDQVLFCPFCGEAFEGETTCPEHELPLVAWSELRRAPAAAASDEQLAWFSLRLGRGLVAAGAALALLSFLLLPLARVEGDLKMGGTMLRLALSGTPRLWLVPAAVWAQLLILYRRRTPSAMRSARLAVALVALVPLIACVWTWVGAHAAVELLAQGTQQELRLRLASGAHAMALAIAAMLAGAARLGTER